MIDWLSSSPFILKSAMIITFSTDVDNTILPEMINKFIFLILLLLPPAVDMPYHVSFCYNLFANIFSQYRKKWSRENGSEMWS